MLGCRRAWFWTWLCERSVQYLVDSELKTTEPLCAKRQHPYTPDGVSTAKLPNSKICRLTLSIGKFTLKRIAMNISTRTVSSSRQLFRAISLLMILGLGEAPNLKADNFRPRIQKLHSHAPDPGGNYFGSGVAVSDQYLLVGEPADDSGPSASVFDAKTGRFLRRISPEDGATTDQFGDHVAVFGHLGLVGASHAARDPSNSNTGAAYLFDLRNGRQLFKLFAFDGASGDQFGISVAMNGELILIGANASANYTGAAYLFDLRTGALRAKLLSSAGAPSSYFGSEVALCGTRALIVSYRGGLQPNTGAVYVHDVTNPSATIYEDYKFSPAVIHPALCWQQVCS